jgi:hypothetical protein
VPPPPVTVRHPSPATIVAIKLCLTPPILMRIFRAIGRRPLKASHRRRPPPSEPRHRCQLLTVSSIASPVARRVGLTSSVLLPPPLPHLVPGSTADHRAAEAALGTMTAQVRACATRRGMGRSSRYGFWARPAIFGRGPKARPSTVDFFSFWFSFI